MSEVIVKPELIRWARERAGLDIDALRGKSGLAKLPEWERGEARPTWKQLESFAKRTAVPFGMLFLPEPPPREDLPIPDFRTVGSEEVERPSVELIETIHTMQLRQAWMRDWLIEDGAEPLQLVGSLDTSAAPEEAAAAMRKDLGLAANWLLGRRSSHRAPLAVLAEHAEKAGLLVMSTGKVGMNTHRPLRVAEFRGFVLLDEYAPLVFINAADAETARLFTLAHELGHVWLGREGIVDPAAGTHRTPPGEAWCNKTAAALLLPSANFQRAWKPDLDPMEQAAKLAKRTRLSQMVVAVRAADLGLAPRAVARSLMEGPQPVSPEQTRSGGGDTYRSLQASLGERFATRLAQAFEAQRIPPTVAYDLTRTTRKTFDAFLEKRRAWNAGRP